MTHVHLVGSVALDSPEQTFALAGELLGPYLKRVPDGEPGGRRLWISWQIPVLRANPGLQPADSGSGALQLVPLRLADGMPPEQLHFGELGSRVRRAPPTRTSSLPVAPAGFRRACGSRWRCRPPTR